MPLALAWLASATRPSSDRTFDLVLRPVRGGAADVAGIEVRWVLRRPATDTSGFSLTAPVTYAGVTGIAERIERLEVRDSVGPLSLSTNDDPAAPGGFPYFRHWRADRPTAGPVVVTYRARVQPDGERNGPPFSLRASAGGVSGAGSGFIVLPEDTLPYDIRLRWDLGDLAAGSSGVTSYADGDFERRSAVSDLYDAWIMAGPVGRYPAAGESGQFSATWLGDPPFDANTEMAWVSRLYSYLGRAFVYLDPLPRYRVFTRTLPHAPCGGGTSLTASFMLSQCVGSGDTSRAEVRETFAHELVHLWVGLIEGPPGITAWFHEGLTTFYTRLMPMRGRFISVDQYLRDINASAAAYYSSPGRRFSADSIARVGFSTENIRHVPYHRGSMYFADLDARIRAASRGRRRLDDLLRPLFERRQRGERIDQDSWIAAVTAELGPAARDEFERVILRGELMLPGSGAFGPCLKRRGKRYDAAGDTVNAFEWVRVAGVPDSICRAW